MGIVYEDAPMPFKGFINPYKMDPVKAYLKHYENYKYLRFIHDNTKDGREKRQANQEVQKAETKMQYWWKMPGIDMKAIEEGKKAIDLIWSGK